MTNIIDFHVHVPPQAGEPITEIDRGLSTFFRVDPANYRVETLVETYQGLDARAVLFSVNSAASTGDSGDTNDYVAEMVRRDPDRFIGFATVDPWAGVAAIREVERSVAELGLRGLKLHPIHQAFPPSDPMFYPLYEACDGLGLPILFHTGFAAAGSALPGGGGLKLKYAAPIPSIDDIAADFPNLTIVMAHPGWPWVEEQIAVALHKPNVYIDLSGWSPRYVPEALRREVGSRLKHKIVFGSDYPYISPRRWIDEFRSWGLSEEVEAGVLGGNAARILGLLDENLA